VGCVAFRGDRSDAAGAQLVSVWLGVVAAVSEEGVRSASGSAGFAADRWDGVEEREQLGDVVVVGGGEQAGERDAVGVRDQVVFTAGTGPVNGAGAGLVAPKSARSVAESQTARVRSSRSA
jgi:hypothetical protein